MASEESAGLVKQEVTSPPEEQGIESKNQEDINASTVPSEKSPEKSSNEVFSEDTANNLSVPEEGGQTRDQAIRNAVQQGFLPDYMLQTEGETAGAPQADGDRESEVQTNRFQNQTIPQAGFSHKRNLSETFQYEGGDKSSPSMSGMASKKLKPDVKGSPGRELSKEEFERIVNSRPNPTADASDVSGEFNSSLSNWARKSKGNAQEKNMPRTTTNQQQISDMNMNLLLHMNKAQGINLSNTNQNSSRGLSNLLAGSNFAGLNSSNLASFNHQMKMNNSGNPRFNFAPSVTYQQLQQTLSNFTNNGLANNNAFKHILNGTNLGTNPNYLNLQKSMSYMQSQAQKPDVMYHQNQFQAQANNMRPQANHHNMFGDKANPKMENITEQKNLKVEDALKYLELVKLNFGNEPRTYGRFLDIMKKFKTSQIDTHGIIQEVLVLFKGHEKLILGFNDFLPAGFKIDIENNLIVVSLPKSPKVYYDAEVKPMNPPNLLGQNDAQSMPGVGSRLTSHLSGPEVDFRTQMNPTFFQGAQNLDMASGGNKVNNHMNNGMNLTLPKPPQNKYTQGAPQVHNPATTEAQMQKLKRDEQLTQALHFVEGIKSRFADDSHKYRAFLDILHKYQTEDATITEVYTEVGRLMHNDADLLPDFANFLPVEERKKALKMIRRFMRKRERRMNMNGHSSRRDDDFNTEQNDESDFDQDFDSDEVDEDHYTLSGIKKTKKRNKLTYRMPKMEKLLLEKIKAVCYGTDGYAQFLRVLQMFAKQVINKDELIHLVGGLFAKMPVAKSSAPFLVQDLDMLLSNRGIVRDEIEDAYSSMPLSEIDFSNAPTCTPSYRKIPSRYPILGCSERSKLCKEVLNDQWVSVPTGSEDFSFKHMRKNIYEEALFKCEDEIYQFDMVIEANRSTIFLFEKLNNQINALNGLEEKSSKNMKFVIGKKVLNVIHLKAISKIYGKYVDQILELLKMHPEKAVPRILQRLKQKNIDWIIIKSRLEKEWEKTQEDNFVRSLDHRSFYFKQSDKKEISGKNLINQMKIFSRDRVLLPKSYRSANNFFDMAKKTLGLIFPSSRDDVSSDDIHSCCMNLMLYSIGIKVHKTAKNPRGDAKFTIQIPEVESFLHNFIARVFLRDSTSNFTEVLAKLRQFEESYLATAAQPATPAKSKSNTKQGSKSRGDTFQGTFYGSSSLYLFLRLYNVLYERIYRVKEECEKEKKLSSLSSPTTPVAGKKPSTVSPMNKFMQVKDYVMQMLDGTIAIEEFEDHCRRLVGSNAYFLFTIDKVLQQLDRVVNGLVNDEKAHMLKASFDEVAGLVDKNECSLEDLVSLYRSAYQALMNQVDGLSYKVRFVVQENETRVDISLVETFPTLKHDRTTDIYGMRPYDIGSGNLMLMASKKSILRSEKRNAKLIADIKMLKKKLEEDPDEEPVSTAESVNSENFEYNLKQVSAKQAWWFCPRFENLIEKKLLNSRGELKRQLSKLPPIADDNDMDVEDSEKQIEDIEQNSQSDDQEDDMEDNEEEQESQSEDGEN